MTKPVDNFKGLTDPDSYEFFGKKLPNLKDPYQALGFIQLGVGAAIDEEGDKIFPGFTYTVGIQENYNLPEFLIIAVNPKSASEIINIIMHWVRTKDFVPEPYKVYTQFSNFKMCLIPVALEVKNDLMSVANVFYRNKNIYNFGSNELYGAYQIIWTDTKNNFPWEDGFEERFLMDAMILGTDEVIEKVKDIR